MSQAKSLEALELLQSLILNVCQDFESIESLSRETGEYTSDGHALCTFTARYPV